MAGWSAWRWDVWTLLWVVWLVAFFVLETVTLWQGRNQELTEHLRPVFQADPLTGFIAFGVWLWLGYHFLLQGWIIPVGR